MRGPENGVLALSSDDPAELALYASQSLFGYSPVAVLAGVDDAADRMTAAATGQALAAPVLLRGGAIGDGPVSDELDRLGAEAVVVVGDETAVADAEAVAGDRDVVRFDPNAVSEAAEEAVESAAGARGGASVAVARGAGAGGNDGPVAALPEAGMIDTNQLGALRAKIPDVADPDQLSEVMLLVDPAEGQEAAVGTARAAGAVPFVVPGGDPGARKEAIDTIAAADPLGVVAIGPGFDDEDRLAWQVEAARQQPAYPHGTQRLAGGTYVAGSFAVPADGAAESIAALAAAAAPGILAAASSAGAMPVVSVTASVQSADAGADGDHAGQLPVESVSAAVKAFREAGAIVVLDIVPGNRPLAAQLDALEPVLAKPGVGVALHPEFRLAGNGAAVEGQVTAAELQAAIDRVAGIVAEHRLPQTMVVVHQSAASSVTDRATLEPRPQVLTVFAAAGPGGGGATANNIWHDVTTDLPAQAAAGWTGEPATAPAAPLAPTLIALTD
ncbi:hypothetical protein GCM10009751_17910 [Myceligenerans crystallogenes]|uniref:Uncharacterized protein n=1 Tax=Myceligenerans crystallogenes TaxID=316335 RepID=A0ABN2NAN2_9MICO